MLVRPLVDSSFFFSVYVKGVRDVLIASVLEKLRVSDGCVLQTRTAAGSPGGLVGTLDDLAYFYTHYETVCFFPDSDYSYTIVAPHEFVPANPVIVGEMCPVDISSSWYIIGRNDSGDYLSIDLHPARLGRCYDSSFDRHGVVGESQIIAVSFTDLLLRLFNAGGAYPYWLRSDFVSLGDAYG